MFFDKPAENQTDMVESTENYLLGRASLNSNNSYDEYKETAKQYMEGAQVRAQDLKEKAMDWLTTFA